MNIGGSQTNTSFANVNSPSFNNYEIGDHFGRSVTLPREILLLIEQISPIKKPGSFTFPGFFFISNF